MKKIAGFNDYFCDVNGNIYSKKLLYLNKKLKMKKKINKNGYESIHLVSEKGKRGKHYLVHRIILSTYDPNFVDVLTPVNGDDSYAF